MPTAMLKLWFLGCCALFGSSLDAQTDIPPLLLRFKNTVEAEQYELGLALAEIQVVSSTKISLHTAPIFWEARFDTSQTWLPFVEESGERPDLSFEAYGVQTHSCNLNWGAFVREYYQKEGRNVSERTTLHVRAGVRCREDRRAYYSDPVRIQLHPLNNTDRAALAFLQRSGLSPYRWLDRYQLAHTAVPAAALDSLRQHWPKSTFTSLAQLAQAYRLSQHQSAASAEAARPTQADKDRILALLVRPLLSRFSFVRYMAEELAKGYL